MTEALLTDAVGVLTRWTAPDAATELTRHRFLDLLGEGTAALRRDKPGAHVTASAVILSADLREVLLCLHGRFRLWVQTGGHCEPGDTTLAAVALREAREESGIDGLRLVDAPIGLDIHPVTCAAGPSVHYDVRFAALAPPGAVAKVSDESDALGWFAPDALPQPLAGSVEEAVREALTAARTRRTGARRAP